jgi:hypothetical protein
MAEPDGLALWVKLIHKLCPLHHQSSSEQEATPLLQDRDRDGPARCPALVQKLYCPPRQPRATVTLNQAAN